MKIYFKALISVLSVVVVFFAFHPGIAEAKPYASGGPIWKNWGSHSQTAGDIQTVPQGYALTAIGYGSDDNKCLIYLKTAPVNPDGTVDFAATSGWQTYICSGGGGSHTTYFFDPGDFPANSYVTGWTWGATGGLHAGGTPFDDNSPDDACYYQEYMDLSTGVISGWGSAYDGTCNDRGYGNEGWLQGIARAPAGQVIVAIGFELDNDANLWFLGMTYNAEAPWSKADAYYTADGTPTVNINYDPATSAITSSDPSPSITLANNGDGGSQMYWTALFSDPSLLDTSAFVMPSGVNTYTDLQQIGVDDGSQYLEQQSDGSSYYTSSGLPIVGWTSDCRYDWSGSVVYLPGGYPECVPMVEAYGAVWYTNPGWGMLYPTSNVCLSYTGALCTSSADLYDINLAPLPTVDIPYYVPINAGASVTHAINPLGSWNSLSTGVHTTTLTFNADNVSGSPTISQGSPQVVTVNLNILSATETNCSDGVDNDGDGNIDGADSDCASTVPGAFTLDDIGSGSSAYCDVTTSKVSLSWSASSNATSYSVYRGGALYASLGNVTSYIDTSAGNGISRTYRIRATNATDHTDSNQISVTTADCTPAAPNVIFNASPASVSSGNSTNLVWTVSGSVDTCTASGDWSGSKDTSGGNDPTPALFADKSYTLSCTGPGGTTVKTANVTVSAAALTLVVVADPGIGGSVKSDDGLIDCGAGGVDCSETYSLDTPVTLTAKPASTYWKFSGWGGDCLSFGSNPLCTLIMDSSKTAPATFIARPLNYIEF